MPHPLSCHHKRQLHHQALVALWYLLRHSLGHFSLEKLLHRPLHPVYPFLPLDQLLLTETASHSSAAILLCLCPLVMLTLPLLALCLHLVINILNRLWGFLLFIKL